MQKYKCIGFFFLQQLETLQDPIEPVEAILKRCNCNQIMLHYKVPAFSDVHEFLALLATRLGRLRKGGIPDKNKAARRVLQDWNECVFFFFFFCNTVDIDYLFTRKRTTGIMDCGRTSKDVRKCISFGYKAQTSTFVSTVFFSEERLRTTPTLQKNSKVIWVRKL